MFTGIIEETGKIQALHRAQQGATIAVQAHVILPELKRGDSVAVNGVCLTVTGLGAGSFSCDLSAETLDRTSFGSARAGILVNLERPLAAGARLGGHFVQGHVDAVGRLARVAPTGEGMVIGVEYPQELDRYLVLKGSVALDGISLTVASLERGFFTVAVIPHTLRATNLGALRSGDVVNLEADILGKYIERLLQSRIQQEEASQLSLGYLKEQGF